MLFERTALSKKPETLARIELEKLRDEDMLTPDLVFRDPYFLDFLGLVELLALEESGIRVAEYMTELPPRKMLEQKLRKAIEHARERFQNHVEAKGNHEPTR